MTAEPPEQAPPDTKRDKKPDRPGSTRFADGAWERRQKTGKAKRYSRRYSGKARLKDLIEEIFDFD